MWNKIQYALIYSWVKVHALLPMWALYILSDILYVLVYKVVRYRVKVVRQNMKAAFPDKSDTELRRLEREFYHHFADYVVETFKLADEESAGRGDFCIRESHAFLLNQML